MVRSVLRLYPRQQLMQWLLFQRSVLRLIILLMAIFAFLELTLAKCPQKCQCRNGTGTTPSYLRVKCGFGVTFSAPATTSTAPPSSPSLGTIAQPTFADNAEITSSEHRLSHWQFLDFDQSEAASVITL